MNKWHGCASLRFELVNLVALWFYSTPKWVGMLGGVLERPHTLFSRVRKSRNGVHFPKRPQNASRSFRRSGPVIRF